MDIRDDADRDTLSSWGANALHMAVLRRAIKRPVWFTSLYSPLEVGDTTRSRHFGKPAIDFVQLSGSNFDSIRSGTARWRLCPFDQACFNQLANTDEFGRGNLS